MDTKTEAQQLIEELRAKRAMLGDKTNTRANIHYKRITTPKVARIIMHFYVFIGGMLFSALLMGYTAASIPLIIISVVAMYSFYRE